jgi:hypothetical protein
MLALAPGPKMLVPNEPLFTPNQLKNRQQVAGKTLIGNELQYLLSFCFPFA